jgi:hypothetical protein
MSFPLGEIFSDCKIRSKMKTVKNGLPRLLVPFYLCAPEFPWGRGWGRMEEGGSPYMGNRLVLWPLGCIPMVVFGIRPLFYSQSFCALTITTFIVIFPH